MNTSTPHAAAAEATERPRLPEGDDERFTGFGVLGLPFRGGDCLALRVMTKTSIGPGYRAVWHRTPAGAWHMFVSTDPEHSCPRYFSAAATYERVPAIDLRWHDGARLQVRIPGVLDWEIALRATPATRAMSALGTALPAAARRSDPLLAAMGPMARPMLRVGRMRMIGAAPNRQRFQVVPTLLWRVADSAATVGGSDLGPIGPLPRQSRIGDFWMPQRGLFYVGDARFSAFDPAQHSMVGDLAEAGTATLMSLALQERTADNGGVGATAGAPTRGEMLAAVSVAIDLGLGQPAEHMMRAAILADRIAARLGLDDARRGAAYQATLLMWIGCTADSQEYARWFGDDIAVRSASYLVDWSGLPFLRFLVEHVAQGRPLGQRALTLAELMRDSRGSLGALLHSHCLSAALLAERLALPRAVQEAVSAAFERYDGRGLPQGLAGDAIPLAMRIAQLADTAEVHERLGGAEAAIRMARERRGGQFDPAIVDAFTADAAALLDIPHGSAAWAAALDCAPDRDEVLRDEALEAAVAAIGDFADLKCPFLLGHSRGVADVAGAAARASGVPAADVTVLRRAAHLHDVGRLGVSNLVWSKPGALDDDDWERVRMHPYLGGRVLSRIPGLAGEAALVRSHHEHVDGSGYPAGAPGSSLTRSDRLLAAAVAYRAAREPRPYRAALDPDEAIDRLHRRVAAGHLDGQAVAAIEAVAAAEAGDRAPRPALPAGLTRREAEILTLVAQGFSNREIATSLFLSEKTVRNHVEHTYAKIGVANRVGASLFAIDHGFVGRSA